MSAGVGIIDPGIVGEPMRRTLSLISEAIVIACGHERALYFPVFGRRLTGREN